MTLEEAEALLADIREWAAFEPDPNDPPPEPRRTEPKPKTHGTFKGKPVAWCYACGRKGQPADHSWADHLALKETA